MKLLLLLTTAGLLLATVSTVPAQQQFETETLPTSAGDLTITFVGHGTLMLEFNGKIVHIDPYSKLADYTKLPKADLILITHEHQDHLDMTAIQALRTTNTTVVLTRAAAQNFPGGIVMTNGDIRTELGLKIEAIPAYNIVHKRDNGQHFHAKGMGNGYVITFGDKRVYVAGDTENIPEMKALCGIDVAFLPMNLPYTMTPAMVADAAKAFKPKILYPYHYGDTDTSKLMDLMKGTTGIEVRVRRMK